ncbi:MAG: hypothetical protein R2882_10060 [Gemmatimonadales bacterium]
MQSTLDLRAGELVEVRSATDILATLDANGCLEGLPFMPEMAAMCGRQFRVYRRADKTCDTIKKPRSLKMDRTVHLESSRCDGAGHDGCQAGCLIFWKEAWLKRVSDGAVPSPGAASPELAERLRRFAVTSDAEGPLYRCQNTNLLDAASPVSWWEPGQYFTELKTGNIGFGTWLAVILRAGVGILRRKFINRRHPFVYGNASPTPTAKLGLQPGELVRIKSRKDIVATLDDRCKNRGLWFDIEQVPFCGGEYRVLKRVDRIVSEKTGRMLHFKSDCIVLDGVYCKGEYARERLLCPRSIYPYWREIWLQRVEPAAPAAPPSAS